MCFINDHLLKGDVFQGVFKVCLEHFVGGDHDVRFEQLGLETESAFGHHVRVVELSVDDPLTPRLPLRVLLHYAVHARPLINGLLPVVNCR